MHTALLHRPNEHTLAEIALREDLSRRASLVMKLRSSGVSDGRILAAIENIPRELFVEAAFRDHAYDDTALPISSGQTISQPTVVGLMTQALDLTPRLRVLEIGTGSGYQTAVLSRLCRRVYTVERHRDLLAVAEQRFMQLRLTNIVTKRADGSKGWSEAAPFERIIVTAAARELPEHLLRQLSPGGIMIVPLGEDGTDQMLTKVTKDEIGNIYTQSIIPVRFVPLVEER
jgi:protein-L-isoaspartate(D-aspartate) O-methyltransferase